MAKFRIPFVDASGEASTFQVNVDDGAAAGDLNDLRSALLPLWVAGDQQSLFIVQTGLDGTDAGKPANKLAQRENKFLITYRDNSTGDLYTAELPCADLTETDASASEVDITSGPGLAAATEWNANVLSPVGNATTMEGIRFVGRNL